ncbi:type 1 glutamine amidotransferase domain-containing protein [Chloroflexota bacterium]
MLDGERIAILIEDGFADTELVVSLKSMKVAGARVIVVGTDSVNSYRSKSGKLVITADVITDSVKAENLEAIIIPGGYAPDSIRPNQSIVELVRKAHDLGKVIAAICYGPQLLISADIVRGRRLTSWHSIATDLINAGADWVDESVVQDGNIITAGRPAYLPMFDKAIIDAVAANGRLSESVT